MDMRIKFDVVLPVRAIHDRTVSGNIAPLSPPDLIVILISQPEVVIDNYSSSNTGIQSHTPRDRSKLRPKDAVERSQAAAFEVPQLIQRSQDKRLKKILRRMERRMTRIHAVYREPFSMFLHPTEFQIHITVQTVFHRR
ncbi:MAG: hypothetical protein WC277_09525 [Bacilli bacterium]